mmetsp:Transcript_90856/g.293348  ORF Transcript_90856/g.293348 Transcript_90856/m.293348 type:complete len:399 (-) Transcript_90856:250-1446(-)
MLIVVVKKSRLVDRGEMEVNKLNTVIHRVEDQAGQAKARKNKQMEMLEANVGKIEAKRCTAEEALNQKVEKVGEARGRLAHMQFAAKMLEAGVIIPTDGTEEELRQAVVAASFSTGDAEDILDFESMPSAIADHSRTLELEEENRHLRELLLGAEQQLAKFVGQATPSPTTGSSEQPATFSDDSATALVAAGFSAHCSPQSSARVLDTTSYKLKIGGVSRSSSASISLHSSARGGGSMAGSGNFAFSPVRYTQMAAHAAPVGNQVPRSVDVANRQTQHSNAPGGVDSPSQFVSMMAPSAQQGQGAIQVPSPLQLAQQEQGHGATPLSSPSLPPRGARAEPLQVVRPSEPIAMRVLGGPSLQDPSRRSTPTLLSTVGSLGVPQIKQGFAVGVPTGISLQ